ncbi:TIGR02594 family protein [Bradyrhizobium sp. 179]|uniref:CHAP domain-containing protein n=1 Tax=Bradyrhizobium sp. 179 TaxID=2782648 RepID=UPI001FFA3EE4|nr:CHAP domain-containing protein [Bradyrhizobium sp. 179]MCK1543308.1 TIGR02594 family protein [Bradyrhizobium sp. 179]
MKRLLTGLVCALAIQSALTTMAEARPRHHRHHASHVRIVQPQQEAYPTFGSFFAASSDIVGRARAHLGDTAREVGVRTNLWCSAFLRKLTGAKDVDDRALSWERHQRVAPQVGAVVTMGRRGGGHVGVVSGFTKNGDPIVISGNHRNRVAESVYPRSRIRAWLSPTS